MTCPVPQGCRTRETTDGTPAGAGEVRGGDVRASGRRDPPEFREFCAGSLSRRPNRRRRSRAVQHVLDAAKPSLDDARPAAAATGRADTGAERRGRPGRTRRRLRNGRTGGRLRLPSRRGRRVIWRARRRGRDVAAVSAPPRSIGKSPSRRRRPRSGFQASLSCALPHRVVFRGRPALRCGARLPDGRFS